jgi:hypothetical protein
MAKGRKPETMRRLRLGDLRKLFRQRYGPTLPDDDAGREDLIQLLLPISLGPTPEKIMRNAIEVAAPWMKAEEAQQLIGRIMEIPEQARRPTAKTLGKRLNVTNAEREGLRLWTIHPADMTDEQMAEQRKAKKRARDECRRQQRGAKSRQIYLAGSLSKQKPWEKNGQSRATWFRHRRQKNGETGPRQAKLTIPRRSLVSREHAQGAKPKALASKIVN